MNRTFDFYEYAGVIVPGAVVILGLLWLFPQAQALLTKDGLTFGEFGVFVILAYAAGQLIQGIGNGIERIFWWICGGLPSTRALKYGKYLGPHQRARLHDALKVSFGVTEHDLAKQKATMQLPVVREMYATVADAKKAQRVDIFSGNYGLTRGLAAALLVLIAVELATSRNLIPTAALVMFLLLSLQRMHRFGRHYAVELITQFLSLELKRAPSVE
jgi:hypothetical protein